MMHFDNSICRKAHLASVWAREMFLLEAMIRIIQFQEANTDAI